MNDNDYKEIESAGQGRHDNAVPRWRRGFGNIDGNVNGKTRHFDTVIYTVKIRQCRWRLFIIAKKTTKLTDLLVQ